MLRLLITVGFAWTCLSALADDGAPKFTETGELLRPADYRQWVYASSGFGMTYGPTRPEPGQAPLFTNVFVNPEAYKSFKQSGRWPEDSFFVMEIRSSENDISIDEHGRTQGALLLVEASVKSSSRFADDGWAFFAFDDEDEASPALPRSASCYNCHASHGAVEWTFAQFYPDLFEIARTFDTVRDDYDPARKVE